MSKKDGQCFHSYMIKSKEPFHLTLQSAVFYRVCKIDSVSFINKLSFFFKIGKIRIFKENVQIHIKVMIIIIILP